MKALVIGASGFIGLNVVDALLEAGFSVRATRRKHTPTLWLRKRAVELVPASLEEPELLREAMQGCEVVYLTGAYYPRYSLDLQAALKQGVTGVRNACDAAEIAGVRRLVYTSTIATLDRATKGLADEQDFATRLPEESVYRGVKWAMECEVDRARERGLDVVNLLPGGCLGPWDLRLGTGGIILGVIRGELPFVVDGTVNMVDVGDVARAHVRAADPAAKGRYCLSGHDVDLRSLFERLAVRYGARAPTNYVSVEEGRLRAEEAEREAAPTRKRVPIPRELVDIAASGQPVSSARAIRELGVSFLPLDEALDRSHEWLKRCRLL